MDITNNGFSNFRMKYCYNFRRLCEAGIVNTRPTLPTLSYKQHSLVDDLKRSIKCNPGLPIFDMVIPLCNDTKLIISVDTKKILSSLIMTLLSTRIKREMRGLKDPGFLQVFNLILWVATGTRYFLLIKGVVTLISLITLIELTWLLPRTSLSVMPKLLCPARIRRKIGT